MGRNKKQKVQAIEVTDERLARAVEEGGLDAWEYINPAKIDSNQPIGLVRRFRASHLDRFYRKDNPERSILTFRQYYAGDWYRNTYHRSGIILSVVASYGERVSGGEPAYGLPRTQRQADARRLWREGRQQFPRQMVGFMDRFLIHDEFPRFYGRSYRIAIRDIGYALDGLADWLKLAK